MSCNITLALYAWWFLPETKKVSLEEMDVLFGGANHTEKGSELLDVQVKSTEVIHQETKNSDLV
ncbi:putative sugar transporter protein [Ilyonectria robusta]